MKILFLILSFFLSIGLALANDSTAMLAAGGLRLTQSRDIILQSEKLLISPKQVTVDYVFLNTSKQPIKTLVAFPLPDLDTYRFTWEDVVLDKSKPVNFLDFSVEENQKAIPYKTEIQAWIGKKNVTTDVKQAGLLLSPFAPDFSKRLNNLNARQKQALLSKKIIELSGNEAYPRWVLKTTFYWEQIFPPHQAVQLTHRYTPVVGYSFSYRAALPQDSKAFCISKANQQRLEQLFQKAEPNGLLNRQEIAYILKTGAHWKGPIQSFKLIIDTETPESVFSTCFPGLKPVTPTTYSTTLKNFEPKSDLRLLIIKP